MNPIHSLLASLETQCVEAKSVLEKLEPDTLEAEFWRGLYSGLSICITELRHNFPGENFYSFAQSLEHNSVWKH